MEDIEKMENMDLIDAYTTRNRAQKGEDPGKIRSKLPITQIQWKEFCASINNNLQIQQEVFRRFNIRRASDIKQGQLPDLIKVGQECMKPSNTP